MVSIAAGAEVAPLGLPQAATAVPQAAPVVENFATPGTSRALEGLVLSSIIVVQLAWLSGIAYVLISYF